MPEPAAMTILDALRGEIITGTIRPGERLRELSLAERFGSSRVPVREALRELAADGYVEIRPNAGAKVAEPPHADVRVLFDMRMALEIATTHSAAERASVIDRTEVRSEWATAWSTTEEILEAGDEAIASGDTEILATLNVRFHNAIGVLSGRTGLTSLLRQLTGRTEWLHASAPQHLERRGGGAWSEHWEILDQIGRGNTSQAADLMSRHLENSRNGYLGSTSP